MNTKSLLLLAFIGFTFAPAEARFKTVKQREAVKMEIAKIQKANKRRAVFFDAAGMLLFGALFVASIGVFGFAFSHFIRVLWCGGWPSLFAPAFGILTAISAVTGYLSYCILNAIVSREQHRRKYIRLARTA